MRQTGNREELLRALPAHERHTEIRPDTGTAARPGDKRFDRVTATSITERPTVVIAPDKDQQRRRHRPARYPKYRLSSGVLRNVKHDIATVLTGKKWIGRLAIAWYQ